jgi:hypothetical protein
MVPEMRKIRAPLLLLAVVSLLAAPVAGAEASSTGSSETAVPGLEARAERIEAELARKPGDEDLLAKLTRTRIDVANAMINAGAGEVKGGVAEIREQLKLASASWSRYLKAARKPRAWLATVVAPALFELAEISTTSQEAFKDVKAAVTAQTIVAEGRPSESSWGTLALFELFAQRYGAADEALEKALTYAHAEFKREALEKRFKEAEKSARKFGKALKRP